MNSHNFFTNHYEKIILAGLLLVFSGLLYWQLSVIQEAQNRKVEHIVNQQEPDADYMLANYGTDAHYAVDKTFSGSLKWADWDKNKDAESKVDMMVPPAMAPCPFCYWMIAKESFPKMNSKKSGKCPNCSHELKPRSSDTDQVQIAAKSADSNNNGISDDWEQQYGIFDTKDEDPDKDGFTNLEEFLANPKTNPMDIKDHPAYATKLVLAGEPKTERIENMLAAPDFRGNGKVELKNVDMDDKVAEFLFKPAKGRQFRAEVSVGDQIPYRRRIASDRGKLPVSGFKLLSIENDNSVKIVSESDSSLVFLCEVGKAILTPYSVVILQNKLDQKTFSTKTGGKLVLGSDAAGLEEYTVEGVGTLENNPFVTVKNAAGKLFIIGLQGHVAPKSVASDVVEK